MDENLKRFLEELQKKQERLAQPAERMTLQALYEEAYDFDTVTICNSQSMLERMEENRPGPDCA